MKVGRVFSAREWYEFIRIFPWSLSLIGVCHLDQMDQLHRGNHTLEFVSSLPHGLLSTGGDMGPSVCDPRLMRNSHHNNRRLVMAWIRISQQRSLVPRTWQNRVIMHYSAQGSEWIHHNIIDYSQRIDLARAYLWGGSSRYPYSLLLPQLARPLLPSWPRVWYCIVTSRAFGRISHLQWEWDRVLVYVVWGIFYMVFLYFWIQVLYLSARSGEIVYPSAGALFVGLRWILPNQIQSEMMILRVRMHQQTRAQ